MVGGMSQPRRQKSRLHAATPCVRYGARARQQPHALVQNQRAGRGDPAIELAEKRPAIVARRNDPAEREHELPELRRFVPAGGRRLCPTLMLGSGRDPDRHARRRGAGCPGLRPADDTSRW